MQELPKQWMIFVHIEQVRKASKPFEIIVRKIDPNRMVPLATAVTTRSTHSSGRTAKCRPPTRASFEAS